VEKHQQLTNIRIRPYEPRDESDVRRICFETAFRGQPIAPYFDDSPLVTEALIGYYVRYEPHAIRVVECDGHVAGYVAGSLDTRRFQRRYAMKILPRVMWMWLIHGHALTRRGWQLLWAGVAAARVWGSVRAQIVGPYPGHLHINLDARARGMGCGRRLLAAFMEYADSAGCAGLHLTTESVGAKVFFEKAGFVTVATARGPAWFGMPAANMYLMVLRGRGGES
jgi:GNAT superfamily N-acetyltransferase